MHKYFSAEHLYKKRDSITINFSASADAGTITVIAGASGSGKSTILRLIAGLEKSDPLPDGMNGRTDIILDGKNITEIPPAQRHIGMVFQNHALFAHLRVRDNVAYGLRCSGGSKTESRKEAEAYLEKFGLAGFGERWPETLSGGEAQRVSLARTLIMNPQLVLFDEPLSSLDPPMRRKLAADIRELQKKNKFTGLWVTHDIAEAKAVADRIILMDRGSKIWEGDPESFNEDMIRQV